jgi:hypothetical protein
VARARIFSLRSRRIGRRVKVVVRSGDATRLVASVLVRGRIVARASRTGKLGNATTFKLRAPRARRFSLRIVAVGAGGSVTRTIIVRAVRR